MADKTKLTITCQMGIVNRQELLNKLNVNDDQFRRATRAFMEYSPEFKKKFTPYLKKKGIKADLVRMLIEHCYGDELELQIVLRP